MLRKITVDQLRVGMHLHKLEGSWMAHPFWKTRFVLTSQAEVQRVQECGVTECWIDTAQGDDVAATAAAAPDAPAHEVPAVAPAPAPASDCSLAEELRRAAAICHRGREAVQAMFQEVRMGRTLDAECSIALVDEIAQSVQRNPGALVNLARLKSRDDYSYMHSVAVCALMVALARQIGLDEVQCREAGLAGLMHDIGKAVMPLEILNKPGKLTDSEFEVMRSHPERGSELLRGDRATQITLDVVLHHHERMDGSGYPHRLPAEQISRLARMGAICDVYDAVTSNRAYKTGWDPAESIARMASWKGHFDPHLFAAFVQSLGIYPTGSRVVLESGRLAVVVEQNPANLVAPVVKAFYSSKSKMRIAPMRIDLSRAGCNDRIVGRDRGEHGGGFMRLDELWVDPEVLHRAGIKLG